MNKEVEKRNNGKNIMKLTAAAKFYSKVGVGPGIILQLQTKCGIGKMNWLVSPVVSVHASLKDGDDKLWMQEHLGIGILQLQYESSIVIVKPRTFVTVLWAT